MSTDPTNCEVLNWYIILLKLPPSLSSPPPTPTQGVPIRVEIGPREVKSDQFVAVPRDGGKKETISNTQAVERVRKMLDELQHRLFDK